MDGLLKGVGMGATFAVCAMFPLPVLVVGGVAYMAAQQKPQPEPEPFTQEEEDELIAFMELMERAPSPEAAEALIEEFYL